MPSFCSVLNCGYKYDHSETVSFHKFPFKRKDLLKKWIEFTCRGTDWKPSKWSSICSRHFTLEEFGGMNFRKSLKKTAVPTIVHETTPSANETELIPSPPTTTKTVPTKESSFEPVEDVDDEEVPESFTESAISPTTNCRLCGICCSSVATFATNFEIFGMIQKCFPTLNIQQDDNLPKDMCTECLKSLNHFSEFIDKVFETQRDYLRNFRSEKSIKPPERPLKIKQEPVVKVKQEATETGENNYFPDELDMAIDDCYQDSCEQKFPFLSDFPMFNAQDIINNCDIMEIINLDDPFIDIPDDDGITTVTSNNLFEKQNDTQLNKQLQALIEDHNYAAPLEETKDALHIEKFYKTEKTEIRDEEFNEFNNMNMNDLIYVNNLPNPSVSQLLNSTDNISLPERNSKPIVTSVNEITDSNLQIPAENGSGKLVVTSISDLLPANRNYQNTESHIKLPTSKPNIVVLNESIVKTGSAFQLHSCNMCRLQFFCQESLNNHNCLQHSTTTLPMVSLPWMNSLGESESPINLAKNINKASCTMCSNSFTSIYDLLRHKHKIHSNVYQKKPFFSSCLRCEKFFMSKISLNNHLKYICNPTTAKLNSKSYNFKCRICLKIKFNHWRLLRNHEISCKKRHPKARTLKGFKCKTCKRVYPKKTSLTRHESYHRPPKRIDMMCMKCNRNFNLFVDLRQHYSDWNSSCKLNTSSDVVVMCMVCNVDISCLQKVRSHRHKRKTSKKTNNARVYPCLICKKIFSNLNNLGQHRITHSEEKRHKCDLCGRVFKRRGGLTQHMKGYHLKMKPHECGVCKRFYALKADMMRCRHSLLKIS